MATTLFFLVGCTEDSFITDLSETFLSPHDTTTTQINFKAYQIPPRLGGHKTLYVGNGNGYEMPFSFLKLGNLSLLSDTLLAIDSAYFQITLDTTRTDTVDDNMRLTLGYLEADSNYSEMTTNYTNIDWFSDGYPKLFSITTEDTSSNLKHVRFYVDSSLVKTWADTTVETPLLVLESQEEIPYILAFQSSENSTNFPVLKVFYHPDTVSSGDTTQVPSDTSVILLEDDVTIVIPPNLDGNNFDSTKTYAGAAAGLRSLIHADIESLEIPSTSVIAKAYLILPIDTTTSNLSSITGVEVQVFSLADTVDNWLWGEVHQEDIYSHLAFSGTFSPKTVISDSVFKIDLKGIVQSLVSGRLVNNVPINNLGFKLMMVGSLSIFDYVAIVTDSTNDLFPRLEVLYEAP